MRLNDLPDSIRVFGDQDWRGKCSSESMEQITFIGEVRRTYPETWGRLLIHPRNEQQLRDGQFSGISRQKAEGMTPGASDIIIPGRVSFVCEMKRRDRTQSVWQPGQIDYLVAAHDAGAFACVALGWEAAWQAFGAWRAHLASN